MSASDRRQDLEHGAETFCAFRGSEGHVMAFPAPAANEVKFGDEQFVLSRRASLKHGFSESGEAVPDVFGPDFVLKPEAAYPELLARRKKAISQSCEHKVGTHSRVNPIRTGAVEQALLHRLQMLQLPVKLERDQESLHFLAMCAGQVPSKCLPHFPRENGRLGLGGRLGLHGGAPTLRMNRAT